MALGAGGLDAVGNDVDLCRAALLPPSSQTSLLALTAMAAASQLESAARAVLGRTACSWASMTSAHKLSAALLCLLRPGASWGLGLSAVLLAPVLQAGTAGLLKTSAKSNSEC